jgi:hypothetical protein
VRLVVERSTCIAVQHSPLNMARKKTQKKGQETTLVPHRTPNLSAMLEEAKSGNAAQAVKAYLDAGGSADALVHGDGAAAEHQIPLLHYMAFYSKHPHKELVCCRLFCRMALM